MVKDTAKPGAPRKGGMTGDAAPPRRARGFLRAAELTVGTLKSAGAKRGFAELRLVTEWRAIVGDALSVLCRPVKVTYGGRGGSGLGATLVVTGEGARAPEIDMQKTRIIDKVNAFYGYRAVSRLVIDQSRSAMPMAAQPLSAQGFAEGQTEWQGAPVASVSPLEGVADQHLALALGRLEANIAARRKVRDTDETKDNDKNRSL